MALRLPYKQINSFIQNESFEPLISWGVRMAISGTVPMVWGIATGKLEDATWITLTAEAISWVEMKGSFTWRVRTLLLGSLLALVWGVIGTVTGFSIILSVLFMFIAGYLSTLLKNLGDRASGLAICVYLLFIICNAYPDKDLPDIRHRIVLICIGAAWPFVVGVCASLVMPVQQPFRRQIALIWRSISYLVDTISRGAADKNHHHNILMKEKDVRTALDNSFAFYGRMAHQANKSDNRQYQLLQLRKNAALVAINITAIAEQMEHIDVNNIEDALRVKAATLFSAMRDATYRVSVYVLTLKTEEKLLAVSQINRMKKLAAIIAEYPLDEGLQQTLAIHRILLLTGRMAKLLESALQRVELMGEDEPVFRSYSLIKTMFVLKPQKIASNIRTLFNFNMQSIRFALRSAIGASIGIFIAKFFHIDHGYWIPFSLMIVIQPYFGATLKKAIDRVAGTLVGGIAGSLFLLLPTGLHIKEAVLFLTFILMVYYVRKQYSIAAFVVTVNLILLFNMDKSYNYHLMMMRALCTIGGSGLAVLSGFALLPAWDKKWLPAHLADAIRSNYKYFTGTFFSRVNMWTRGKGEAESKNSIVFESFNRYMQEPGKGKYSGYYDIITCNVRITRDLNNINLEQEEKRSIDSLPYPAQQMRLKECLQLFDEVLALTNRLDPESPAPQFAIDEQAPPPFRLNDSQMISLEKLRIELISMIRDLKELVENQ